MRVKRTARRVFELVHSMRRSGLMVQFLQIWKSNTVGFRDYCILAYISKSLEIFPQARFRDKARKHCLNAAENLLRACVRVYERAPRVFVALAAAY